MICTMLHCQVSQPSTGGACRLKAQAQTEASSDLGLTGASGQNLLGNDGLLVVNIMGDRALYAFRTAADANCQAN